ncbi:MAG: hypothetical protein WA160_13695 [Pseudobdellovibrio sp.]
MSLKSSFIQHLLQKYPKLTAEQLETYVSEQLISPFQVPIKKSIISDIKNEIEAYWKLRSFSMDQLSAKFDSLNLKKANNYSACMSYDFHLNENNQLELIEINTNAAFLALGLELYSFWKIKNSAGDFDTQDLVNMFLHEMQLAGSSSINPSIAILDENPEQQRLYLEFLVFKYIFENHNIKSDILNINQSELLSEYSLVYNRYTDFYLQDSKSQVMKNLYNANQIHLSPNPWEYFLLADKQRLIDWNQQTEIAKPTSLLPTYDLAAELPEKIWAERKNLFFKPKNSFGGKQAYRGASISRKAFDDVCTDGFIAQKISAPAELEFILNADPIKLKYDLRCYAYQDKLQLIVARLYQGQTTNLKTTGGGFACIVAVD